MASHSDKIGGAEHGQGLISPRTYVIVGLILAVVTGVEVAIPYTSALRGFMVPLLFLLGAVKFAMVAAYFMHLKFDRRVLTWVFSTGLVIALVVIVAMILVMAA